MDYKIRLYGISDDSEIFDIQEVIDSETALASVLSKICDSCEKEVKKVQIFYMNLFLVEIDSWQFDKTDSTCFEAFEQIKEISRDILNENKCALDHKDND